MNSCFENDFAIGVTRPALLLKRQTTISTRKLAEQVQDKILRLPGFTNVFGI
jgi:hypothetical protein